MIQPLAGDNRNAASAAASAGVPNRLSGYRAAIASRFAGEFSKRSANGVSTSAGAIALTRIRGAHSAASERTSPSTAPLAAAIEECMGMPCPTATVLNRTTLAA